MTYAVRTVDNGTGTDYNVAVDALTTPDRDFQRVKLAIGAENSATDLAPGQATMANSIPVAIASNQSPVPMVENALMLTGAAAQTATVNNILENPSSANATDVSNYRSMAVQVVSTGTAGTFIFEQSNDNVNFRPLPVFNSELAVPVPITAAITATASQIVYTVPIRCRYVRLRIASTITGGSIQAFSRVSTEPWTPSVATVAQGTAANLAATVASTTLTAVTPGTAAANLGKAEDAVAASGDTGVFMLAVRNDGATTAPASASGDYSQVSVDDRGRVWQALSSVTCTATITRPADTTAYAADDNFANSTTAPTAGGYTLTGAALQSGGGGMITDMIIVSGNNPTTKLQGEVWIFDTSVTAINDNAAFTLSDTDAAKLVAIVPFTLNQYGDSAAGGNSMAHITGLDIGYNCVGSADLRFLVKVKNAYTPASAEVLTVRAKCIRY